MSRRISGFGSMRTRQPVSFGTAYAVNFRENQSFRSKWLFEPCRINFLEAAVLDRDVQPLIDERLEGGVALQPVGLLGEVERLFRMHRAKHAGMKLLLVSRLR